MEFNGVAEIKHLNIRKQGPDDEKELALDVKIAGLEVSASILPKLLGCENASVAVKSFWDAEGDPKFSGIEDVESWAEFKGLDVRIEGVDLRKVDGKKFHFKPVLQEKIMLSFQLSCLNVMPETIAELSEYVADTVRIRVEQEQQELEFEHNE